jgi:uncharacterized protein (DUF111 family)
VYPDTPNVLQAMMKLEQANARAKTANKVALEAEKEKDVAEKAVEELKRQLQPKRTRSDASVVPRHYAKRPFSCWCQACSRVRGRGLGSQSSDPHLLVAVCTRTKQTAWIEDQFTVTSSAGIRNREKRAADTVARELKRAKPGVWGCIQAREVWSTEEEVNMRSGHFWICKLGTFPGSMTCVERKFELQDRK